MGKRPGYLNGFQGMRPKHRIRRRAKGLGMFGKGTFVPSPGAAPPPPATGAEPLSVDEYLQTRQDKRCPEGEMQKMVACAGADCDPGEQEPDCVDDPLYRELDAKEKMLEEEKVLKQELKQIELQAAEEKRNRLRDESIAREMQQEQEIFEQRAVEQANMQKAAIFGVGGIAVLMIGTLIYKMVT